jgi:hypothetical protein
MAADENLTLMASAVAIGTIIASLLELSWFTAFLVCCVFYFA